MLSVPAQAGKDQEYAAKVDPQGINVEKWERAWRGWSHSNLTVPECREAARRACVYLKVPPVRLSFHRAPRYSWCYYKHGEISLNTKRHKNLVSVLHEVSHHAAYVKHGEVPAHGKEFIRIYLRLLIRARIAPHSALHASLEAYGVEW